MKTDENELKQLGREKNAWQPPVRGQTNLQSKKRKEKASVSRWKEMVFGGDRTAEWATCLGQRPTTTCLALSRSRLGRHFVFVENEPHDG